MAFVERTPIVVGVGDVKNKSLQVKDAIEPMQLMLQAIYCALEDVSSVASVKSILQSHIDSVSVVATWTWPYADLPGLLSKKLEVDPKHRLYSPHGGNQPAKLFDEAARRIARGESRVALVTGGEALASLSACTATKILPPGWTSPDSHAKSVNPLKLELSEDSIGAAHAIGMPVHVYPLYENGFRAYRGQSIEQNNSESAQLYAEFSKIAERNEFAWKHGQQAVRRDEIATVTQKNRMICFPYPLLMNAFNNVNLAASCILTSTDYARELDIPENKWVYPVGASGTQDSENFWERPNYYSSPAISRTLDACLEASGLTRDEIDLYDFYSCFPIVPKLACQHLGLPFANPLKPITLLGGLTSFGGAGNNYSMHALTAMVRELRTGHGQNGLILANGGVLTYQHAVCLSRFPRRGSSAYPKEDPLPPHAADGQIPAIDALAEGEASIETYTVEYDRANIPTRGYVIGRLNANQHRFIANAANAETLNELSSKRIEPIGRKGWVTRSDHGRNIFTFYEPVKHESKI